MRLLCTLGFAIAALVNLAPVSGAFSAAQLERLYGLPFDDANLRILMHHRAWLFGIVGSLLAAAVFLPSLRRIATSAGLVSMLSFVAITLTVGEGAHNTEIGRVMVIDVVASVILAMAAWLDPERKRPQGSGAARQMHSPTGRSRSSS